MKLKNGYLIKSKGQSMDVVMVLLLLEGEMSHNILHDMSSLSN